MFDGFGGVLIAAPAHASTVLSALVLPAPLAPALDVMIDMLLAPTFDADALSSERDVVKEEYRQRIAASPYGEFYLDTIKKSFAVHPYKRPGIGSIAELDASKLHEVKAFHAPVYRPENATLVGVGDFKPNT